MNRPPVPPSDATHVDAGPSDPRPVDTSGAPQTEAGVEAGAQVTRDEAQATRPRPPAAPTGRDARLKAALRANLGRRKAQARSRDAAEDADGDAATAAPPAPLPHTTNTSAPNRAARGVSED